MFWVHLVGYFLKHPIIMGKPSLFLLRKNLSGIKPETKKKLKRKNLNLAMTEMYISVAWLKLKLLKLYACLLWGNCT